MARTEGYSDGRAQGVQRHADIDYGFIEARTTTGRIGVKCWINNGEVMPEGFRSGSEEAEDSLGPRPGRKRRDAKRPGQRDKPAAASSEAPAPPAEQAPAAEAPSDAPAPESPPAEGEGETERPPSDAGGET